jgi:hypothetical protein
MLILILETLNTGEQNADSNPRWTEVYARFILCVLPCVGWTSVQRLEQTRGSSPWQMKKKKNS